MGISYCADNGHFKVFDSLARDVYSKSHTLGTCILLNISSTDNLVHYSQSLYGATDLYELKGLQITKYDVVISNNVREVLKRSSRQHRCYKNHCFVVVLYSICYSIISPCKCWNSNTLAGIIENGSQLNNTMQDKRCLTSVTLTDSVIIFGTNINVHDHELNNGELSNLTGSRISLETFMVRNHTGKTSFLTMDATEKK